MIKTRTKANTRTKTIPRQIPTKQNKTRVKPCSTPILSEAKLSLSRLYYYICCRLNASEIEEKLYFAARLTRGLSREEFRKCTIYIYGWNR